MISVTVRFHAELNDLLPRARRNVRLDRTVNFSTTVKDLIESFNVPHTEVDLIKVNGERVDFSYRIGDGDAIDVYPVSCSRSTPGMGTPGNDEVLEPKFVAGRNLRKLARKLRLLGFSVLHDQHATDEQILGMIRRERRILLARNRGLLMNKSVGCGYYLRSDQPFQQVIEVVRRFQLATLFRAFTRCANCDGLLAPVSKQDVLQRLEIKTRRYFHEFVRCAGCNNVYWKGSHYPALTHFIERVHAAAGLSPSAGL